MGKFVNWLTGVEPEENKLEVRSDSPTTVAPPKLPNIALTVDSALGLGPVGRSVNLIQTLGSSISWDAYKDGRKLQRQPKLITNPSVNGSEYVFKSETLNSLACYGNAYWRIYGEGQSTSLEVLNPDWVHKYRDANTGREVFDYTDENGRTWNDIKVKHLKMNRRPGHLYGYGPIQLFKSELRRALMIRAYADNWFSNGVPMGALVATDGYVASPDEKQEIAEAFKAYVEKNVGLAFLDGYQYKHFGINPKEAMFVEVWQEVVKDIARMFGIPAMHLLAELSGTSMTYTNLEQDQILFLQDTINGYLNEIENAMADLLPRGTVCKFNEDDLLRMDHKTKWDVRKTQQEIGYADGNDLRQQDGLDPLPRKEAIAANDE